MERILSSDPEDHKFATVTITKDTYLGSILPMSLDVAATHQTFLSFLWSGFIIIGSARGTTTDVVSDAVSFFGNSMIICHDGFQLDAAGRGAEKRRLNHQAHVLSILPKDRSILLRSPSDV
jgi:hypothetical protein